MVIEDHQVQSWEEHGWQLGDNHGQKVVDLLFTEVCLGWAMGCWLGDHQVDHVIKL